MSGMSRPRRFLSVALFSAIAVGLAACNVEYPNSTFNPTTDHNADVLVLWDQLMFWGTIVFLGTELVLIYTLFRFRRKPGQTGVPKQVHGNTVIEIIWTGIPVLILTLIAIPTVRTIFKTQAKAAPDSLQVEVIGHQWWWEFRYPQYGIVTANELYIPKGRTVNFALTTVDVIHSFWVPQLSGKRDLVTNRTNYLWFTPKDSLASSVWNGFCAEYCGTSHANMKFRTYTVTPEEFDMWVAHQKTPAAYPASTGAAEIPAVPLGAGAPPQGAAEVGQSASSVPDVPVWTYPVEKIREEFPHAIPMTKPPASLVYNESLLASGDPERGMQSFMMGGCIGCHTIAGNPTARGIVGPNLTHIATRHTIAAGVYENTPLNLALWIKSAPHMKPGSLMPTIGKGIYDPTLKAVKNIGALTDEQIADVVAYLNALK